MLSDVVCGSALDCRFGGALGSIDTRAFASFRIRQVRPGLWPDAPAAATPGTDFDVADLVLGCCLDRGAAMLLCGAAAL